MQLDLSPLRKALDSLGRALTRWRATPGDEELRDACIQRFEYSFELSWKMIKRQIVADGDAATEVEGHSKRTLFRIAAERSWIEDPARWFDYLTQRNKTSHAYDAKVAAEVAAVLLQFHADAQALLTALEARRD
jgi:nucleotidyltransferase substrate binding protein (TIGR01987 family)